MLGALAMIKQLARWVLREELGILNEDSQNSGVWLARILNTFDDKTGTKPWWCAGMTITNHVEVMEAHVKMVCDHIEFDIKPSDESYVSSVTDVPSTGESDV
jgi:hypothetical protein